MFSKYITSIFSVGICAFICETLCDSFTCSKIFNRTLNAITSLVLFIIIVIPFCSMIKNYRINSDAFTFEETTSVLQTENLIDLSFSELENSLTEKIKAETGILTEDIRINYSMSKNTPVISGINVTVGTTSKDKKEALNQYLKTLFANEIKIEITEK